MELHLRIHTARARPLSNSGTHFTSQHLQARSTLTPHEFWVACLFPPSCHFQSGTAHGGNTRLGCAVPGQWTHQRAMSRRKALVRTLHPASRHTLAAAFSSGNPPRRNLSTTAHADRWWPRTSRGRPHRQVRVVGVEEWEAKATKQQHSKQLWLQPASLVPWKTDERHQSEWASLRPQQCSFGHRQSRLLLQFS